MEERLSCTGKESDVGERNMTPRQIFPYTKEFSGPQPQAEI
jgi:hypothetical protein